MKIQGEPDRDPRNDKGRVGKAIRRANWANVLAFFALLVSAFSTGYTIWADRQRYIEQINVVASRFFGDYPTQLTEWPGTGLIDTLWRIDISNLGERPASITGYDVITLGIPESGVSYTGLDRGLMSEELKTLSLPIIIPAGHTKRLYARIGAMLDPEAWNQLHAKVGQGNQKSIEVLLRILYENGIDIYGNTVEVQKHQGGHIFRFPPQGGGHREQIFLFTFKTARGTRAQTHVSWYSFSGLGT